MQQKLTNSEIIKKIKEINKNFYENIKTVKWIRRQLYKKGFGKVKQMKMLRYNYNINKWDLNTYDFIQQEKALITCNKLLKQQKEELYKDKYKNEFVEKEVKIDEDKSIDSDQSLESLVSTLNTTFENRINQLTEKMNNLLESNNKIKDELAVMKDFRRLKLDHDTCVELKKIDLIKRMFPECNDGEFFICSGFLRDFENLVRNCYYSEVDDIIKVIEVLSENYHANTFFECKRILDRTKAIIDEYKRLNNSADKGRFKNYHTEYEEKKLKDENLTQENKKIRYDLIELRREEYCKKQEELANKMLEGVKEQKELVQMKLDLVKSRIQLKDLLYDNNTQYLQDQIKRKEKALDKMGKKMFNIKNNIDNRVNFSQKQQAFHQALNDIKVKGYRQKKIDVDKKFGYSIKMIEHNPKYARDMERRKDRKLNKELRNVDTDIKLNLNNEYKEIRGIINDKNVSVREFKKMIKDGKFYTLNQNAYRWNMKFDKDGYSNWMDNRSLALGGNGGDN